MLDSDPSTALLDVKRKLSQAELGEVENEDGRVQLKRPDVHGKAL